jgi:membrane protease YdiL (CAAX protease family)
MLGVGEAAGMSALTTPIVARTGVDDMNKAQETSPPNSTPAGVGRGYLWRIVLGAAVMYLVLQGGLNLLTPRIDLTLAAIVVAAAMMVVAFLIERWSFGRDFPHAFRALGLSRPRGRAMVVSLTITAAMAAFFPAFSLATGVPIELRPDWLWVLLGAIALNGIAEETLFRGFVFGHLRQAGQSFWRAGFTSLLIFALVHLYLFATNPALVATLALIVAIVAAFPLAFLYERAGNTIWAGVVLHVGAHFFRLVNIPEAQYMTVALTWLVLQIGVPFLVLLFANNLLKVRAPHSRPIEVAGALPGRGAGR